MTEEIKWWAREIVSYISQPGKTQMPLLSQINVIPHHVCGIASCNQNKKKKKKKKLSREKTAGQGSG